MSEQPRTELGCALEAQQRRRTRGVPTISVLVGDSRNSCNEWTSWNALASRPTITWRDGSPDSLLVALLKSGIPSWNLKFIALDYLARITGQPVDTMNARFSAATSHSLGVYLEQLPISPEHSGIVKWVLEQIIAHNEIGTGNAEDLSSLLLRERITDLPSAIASLAVIVGVHRVPSIMFVIQDFAEHELGKAPERTVHLSAAIAEALPTLPVAVCVGPRTLELYLSSTSDTHAKAIFREGIIEIPQPHLESAPVSAGASPVSSPTADPNDAAKSAAERFLFRQLESRPETAGLFRQNASLNIQFGNRSMEVDFFAESCGIAIELDGYYHFTSVEHYRRDRRKDLEFQRLGIFVLRFLAEDVVSDLEHILETIQQTIEVRRQQPMSTPRTTR